ncbi:MAG: YIP1 family protein [Halobacteriota archaeon]|nr:YIP1 family protein [Halobacteriota archaeon]
MIIGVFFFGFLHHLFISMMGGLNGVGQTIKALLYGQTPFLLIGWIPIINIITPIWCIILIIVGISEYQEISTWEALKAIIYSAITMTILWVMIATTAFFGALSRMDGLPYPFMMP